LIGGPNTYGYVGGNPLTHIDPLGLIKDSVESAIESAIVRGDVKALRTLSEIVTDPRKRKLLEEGIKKLTTRADDFIAQNCKASVNRQFPGQFRDKTLEQIFSAARSGDRAARTAKKLLTDSRFLK
jgi:uncharacterized protein RhaS with RHS repeats